MVELIKKISEINAVSGNEDKIREFIKKNIIADSVSVDRMGNITAFKKGNSSEKTLMLSTHTDECGMIVTNITDNGYIKFDCVGNTDLRSLISKPVIINDKVQGVIGLKAIHLQKAEERKNIKEAKELYIDIGAKDKAEAEKSVQKGDYISFMTKSKMLGNNVKGKALGRIGVAVLLELIKKKPEFDTYYTFTVQKEVGMRGAAVCMANINPDNVIVIDSIEAADMFDVDKKDTIAHLGKGSVLVYSDKGAISDQKLCKQITDIAIKENIDIQTAVGVNTKSDCGEIITSGRGFKTVNISIPIRYANTPVQLAAVSDVKNTVRLLEAILRSM